LSNQSVQVGVGGALNVQVSATDIVDGLVVNHEGTVGVFQSGVGGQDGVVGLDNGSGDLRGGVDGEFQFGLLAIVDRETFQRESTETGTSTTTEGVEDQETLETGTVVGQFSDTVQNQVDDFFTNGVVTTGIVVGGIFLSGDQLFGVEELTVGTGTDFIDDSGLQINKDGSGNVLAGTSLREESVERVVTTSNGLVRGHLTIRLDTVFQTVEFPTGVTNLDTGLTDMDRDTFTHF